MKKWIIFTFALIIPLSVVSSVKAYEPVTGTVTSNVPWTKLVKPKANALLNGVITIELGRGIGDITNILTFGMEGVWIGHAEGRARLNSPRELRGTENKRG